MVMLYILLCVLILAILGTGAYYASQHVVTLRINHKMLTDEHNRAVEYIQTLEEDIKQLTFERDQQTQREQMQPPQKNGWNNFDIR